MEKSMELAEALMEILKENLRLQLKIEKAIEHINQRLYEVEKEELQWIEMGTEDYKQEYNQLLEILGDKENEET